MKTRTPVAAAAPAAVIIECSDSSVTMRAVELAAVDPAAETSR